MSILQATPPRHVRSGLVLGAGLVMAGMVSLGGALGHAEEEKVERAVIHFADLNGIDTWRADGKEAILIKGRNKQWYRATFFGPCLGLQFTDTIGFVTEPTGDLDCFSSILVDGDRCYFRTFRRIPDPDARSE